MKRVVFIVISAVLLLGACGSNKPKGINGGMDSAENAVTGNKGSRAAYERESVRMVKIDGKLYYETGEDSLFEIYREAFDGKLVKGADKYEIPQGDGEANFSCSGYYVGDRENTIEIPIGDDMEIFEKINTGADVLKYRYCYILEERAANAADESELLVLSNDMETTFDEAEYKMLGSDTTKMKDIFVLPIAD